eukprot:TRINITY_DN1535_c0_g1_i2.p3 TRINITY_DN1535_c0_g1~~TRINITY_DN1535_c0_g1_i2.p3  ORF type:complete len:191 (+),score=66.96 TRINITY_DN1535_c0_g1_i2:349-921(+)
MLRELDIDWEDALVDDLQEHNDIEEKANSTYWSILDASLKELRDHKLRQAASKEKEKEARDELLKKTPAEHLDALVTAKVAQQNKKDKAASSKRAKHETTAFVAKMQGQMDESAALEIVQSGNEKAPETTRGAKNQRGRASNKKGKGKGKTQPSPDAKGGKKGSKSGGKTHGTGGKTGKKGKGKGKGQKK